MDLQSWPTFKFPVAPRISEREWNLCRELAYLHLKDLGASTTKPAAQEVVEMIFRNAKFTEIMKRITKTPLDKVLGSLPCGSAGTRGKAFLKRRRIKDLESLVRLSEKEVEDEYGVGLKTVSALRCALKKNDLRFGMLLPRPLDGNHAE